LNNSALDLGQLQGEQLAEHIMVVQLADHAMFPMHWNIGAGAT